MLIYMAVPVSIMVGLCIFSYLAGRYVRIGKKSGEVKAPEMIREPELPKDPDRVPILEEEISNLKNAIEAKNKELEERNLTVESLTQENQKLLEQICPKGADKVDEQGQKAEDTVEPAGNLPQPEGEPAASNIPAQSASALYEAILSGIEEKPESEKPQESAQCNKPEEKAEYKNPRKDSKRKPRRKK